MIWLVGIFLMFGSISMSAQGIHPCANAKHHHYQKMSNRMDRAKIAHTYSSDLKSRGYDVKFYGIDLKLDYDFNPETKEYLSRHLYGDVLIQGLSQDTIHLLEIDLSNAGMSVDSVAFEGKKIPYLHENDRVWIDLSSDPLLPNSEFSIEVYYNGIPQNSGFGSFVFDSHGDPAKPVIYSLSEPFGAQDWLPCKNDPADKADSIRLSVKVPDDMYVASNGILENKIQMGDSSIFIWVSRYPIAPYLISITISDFQIYEKVYKSELGYQMPFVNYVYPELNTPENHNLIDQTLGMLNLFEKLLGKYPFSSEKYGHANFPLVYSGMEHQTCSSVGDFGNRLVAHELGHQWFGDKITCQNWEHIWLNEGFATYTELLFEEHLVGKQDYRSHLFELMQIAKSASGSIFVERPDDVLEIFNSTRTYAKGAIVLHMLRNILGDSIFGEGIRKYINGDKSFKNATTEDFQDVMESISGLDLDYFFKQWIYGYQYPIYKVGWKSGFVPQKGTAACYIKVLQEKDTINLRPFQMPVTLRLVMEDGGILDTTLVIKELAQEFTISTPKLVTSMEFDPDSAILKKVFQLDVTPPDSLILAYEESYLDGNGEILLYPNPVLGDRLNIGISGGWSVKDISGLVLCHTDGNVVNSEVMSLAQKEDTANLFIDLKDLPQGYYFLRIKFSDQSLKVLPFVYLGSNP